MARPASDIAERIVHAARSRFLLEGVDGASLRQIAKDAGTNIGMVYYYFKTKDDLFVAVVEEVYGRLLAELTPLLRSELPEEQRLSQLLQRFANLRDEEFQVVRLVLREALISSARLTRVGHLFLGGHIPVLMRCLIDGVQHGRLRADVPPLALMAATFGIGIMPQLATRLVRETQLPAAGALPSSAHVAELMGELLLRGIARR